VNSNPSCPPEVFYTPDFLSFVEAQTLFAQLMDKAHWQQGEVKVFGKLYAEPRLSVWYGDANAHYTYSGKSQAPLPWLPVLARLRQRISQAVAHPFNSVLLNLYRDGDDAMGMHSDNEKELGNAPCIASLSLGATRRFVFHHRFQKAEKYTLDLPAGSLLVMKGQTQQLFKHGVPRQKRVKDPRINLTFRYIYDAPYSGTL
jgi:alkylated DNA repair dioxygenase AlkB